MSTYFKQFAIHFTLRNNAQGSSTGSVSLTAGEYYMLNSEPFSYTRYELICVLMIPGAYALTVISYSPSSIADVETA